MKVKREIEIMSYLKKHGIAKIEDLSSIFGVSKNTIRRDLQSLETQGLITIKRGGAILNKDMNLGISLTEREIQYIDEKQGIGEAAKQLISDGDSILLDAGTTTEQIAEALKTINHKGLTVITNALNILAGLSDIPEIISVSTGGVLNSITRCFTGFNAEQFLSQFHVNIAFLSAGGITPERVTNTNALEIQMKKKMIEISDKVVLVVTHNKIGKTSLTPFATPNQIDTLITDSRADSTILQQLSEKGIEIVTC